MEKNNFLTTIILEENPYKDEAPDSVQYYLLDGTPVEPPED